MGVEGPRLTVPRFVRAHEVAQFLQQSSDWIEDKLRELAEHGARFAPPRVGVNDSILFRGERVPVVWRDARIPKACWRPDESCVEIALDLNRTNAMVLAQRAMRNFLIAEMRRDVVRITRVVSDKLGTVADQNRTPSETRVLPLKTIWGSMSFSNRMTLDLSLILAPPRALEYVIEHEMCHIEHKNHSRRFWHAVRCLDPDFTTPRDWLTENGQVVKSELLRWIRPSI